MASVAWTPQALEDLEAVCLYIARDAPSMAEFFAVQAFEVTDQLKRFPGLGRVVPEIGLEAVREVFLHSYRIIYRYQGERVEVLTVHHGARRFPEVR